MADLELKINPVYIPLLRDNNRFLVLRGGGGCFSADTKVQTDGGLKPISEIKEGDMVLSYNHTLQKKEYQKVYATHKFASDKPLVKIKMKNGTEFIATADHKFYVGDRYIPLSEVLK